MPYEHTPNHLREWRSSRRLTRAQLAALAGTTDAVISLLESGERPLSAKWLTRLARPLDVTPQELGAPPPPPLSGDAPMDQTPSPNFLAAWRLRLGLTQAQLALMVGTTSAVISLLESGERPISERWLNRLSAAIDVPPSHIAGVHPANARPRGGPPERDNRTYPQSRPGRWRRPPPAASGTAPVRPRRPSGGGCPGAAAALSAAGEPPSEDPEPKRPLVLGSEPGKVPHGPFT